MKRTVTRKSNDNQHKQAEKAVKNVNKPKTLVNEGGDNK